MCESNFDSTFNVNISAPCMLKTKGMPDRKIYTVTANSGPKKFMFTVDEYGLDNLKKQIDNLTDK